MATLDDTHYKGSDLYSDGPIEDEILSLLDAGPITLKTLAGDNRWPLLYHFSPERHNLLDWFPFDVQGNLLEVGAGCGALTGLFCDKLSCVRAVELSLKRSQIIHKRHHSRQNLRITAGNLLDISNLGLFKYITLIGVLEYAAVITNSSEPHLSLLKHLFELLPPGGRLLLAIENKFGLKYFAGAPEDHTGRYFDGIEGYPSGAKVLTFSREELGRLLKKAGFARCDFYYPHPDYKLPREIFSDVYLPSVAEPLHGAPNYDHRRLRMMDESRAWKSIIQAGKFDFFANSFLVVAQK